MSDLIKRIDEAHEYLAELETEHNIGLARLGEVFRACKAEILRLSLADETQKAISEQYWSRIKSLEESLSKPYVPMTIFECYDVAASYDPLTSEHLSLIAHTEASTINRYEEQRGK